VLPGPQSTIVCALVLGVAPGAAVVVCDVDVLQFSRPAGLSARPSVFVVVLELLSDLLPPGPILVVLLSDVLVCASALPAASIAAKATTTYCFMTNSWWTQRTYNENRKSLFQCTCEFFPEPNS
jgi:hypothetical protein